MNKICVLFLIASFGNISSGAWIGTKPVMSVVYELANIFEPVFQNNSVVINTFLNKIAKQNETQIFKSYVKDLPILLEAVKEPLESFETVLRLIENTWKQSVNNTETNSTDIYLDNLFVNVIITYFGEISNEMNLALLHLKNFIDIANKARINNINGDEEKLTKINSDHIIQDIRNVSTVLSNISSNLQSITDVIDKMEHVAKNFKTNSLLHIINAGFKITNSLVAYYAQQVKMFADNLEIKPLNSKYVNINLYEATQSFDQMLRKFNVTYTDLWEMFASLRVLLRDFLTNTGVY